MFFFRNYKTIKFYNSLTKEKEEFSPQTPPKVRVYSCGPTVYERAHIGNLRSYVFADTLRRVLVHSGYTPDYIINITDVGHLVGDEDMGEDKIEKSAREKSMTVDDLVNELTQSFFDDLILLNIPLEEYSFPKASEYIDEQIDFIKKIEKKGYIYKTADGVYFDTEKMEDYGALGLIPKTDYSRAGSDLKKNRNDFALWRLSEESGPKRQQEWDSPWGVGFPGWHIECSTMAYKILGELDIHTGGVDHTLIHHNNEIAQTAIATGKQLSRVWMHNEFITIDDTRVGKSEGNAIYLSELSKKFSPLAYKYLLLTVHYRSKMNFSEVSLDASQQALNRLIEFAITTKETGKVIKPIIEKISEHVRDDLNTPLALSALWDVVRNEEYSDADRKATMFEADKIFGLNIEKISNIKVPLEIKEMVENREHLRMNKKWKEADEIRAKIFAQGFHLKDTDKGTVIIPK